MQATDRLLAADYARQQNEKRATAMAEALNAIRCQIGKAKDAQGYAITGICAAALLALAEWWIGERIPTFGLTLMALAAAVFAAHDVARASLKTAELHAVEAARAGGYKLIESEKCNNPRFRAELAMPIQVPTDTIADAMGNTDRQHSPNADDTFLDALRSAAVLAAQDNLRREFVHVYREDILGLLGQLQRLSLAGGATRLHPAPPHSCDICDGAISGSSFFVDGRRGDGAWANQCAGCFLEDGGGIGWGIGQLYWATDAGGWRLIAGQNPDEQG